MSVFGTPGVYLRPIEPPQAAELMVGVPAFLGLAGSSDARGAPIPLQHWLDFVAAFPSAPTTGYLAAAVRGFFQNGGTLCYVAALPTDLEWDARLAAGLAAVAETSDIDLVAVPDLAGARQPNGAALPLDDLVRLQQSVIDDCDRNGSRLALIDPAADADIDSVLRHRRRLSGTNAAFYYPWLVVRGAGQEQIAVPPCGHVAGIYAATDASFGVFKAPANAALEGVLDLSRLMSDTDQDRLNPAGVNALRAFRGRGIRIWGARTVSSDPNWRYVNVRRLFMTAGRWIERNLTSLTFEPHNTQLWARIARELTAYFEDLFQQGALKGASAAEAFLIKCDAENNPPEIRQAGMVVADVTLAAAVPNEFIVVRISVAQSGVTLAALG